LRLIWIGAVMLPVANRIKPKKRQKPAGVITDPDAVLHKDMLAQQQSERHHR
jgi:hypothetical protein